MKDAVTTNLHLKCCPARPPAYTGAAAFQQKQFQNGGKTVESARVPLTIETIFSLKIPGRIHPGSTLEKLRLVTIRLQDRPFNEEVGSISI